MGECSWVESFDYNKGGTEGKCAHPPSAFDDGRGNFTCLPDEGGGGYYATSYYGEDDGGDDYTGGGLFFGDDLEHVETTTITRSTTTTVTTTRTYTTTTVTTTTVTHKTEQETMAPNSNKIPCIEEGVMTTCDAPVSAEGFFDFASWAVDIGFEANFYTLLDEGQKLDVEIKTQLAVQARMKRSGIIEGKFGNTKAHGFTGRRARRGVKGYLIVRVEFTDGMLGTEISELTSSIISQPVTFRIYGSSVEYSSTSVTTVDKREKQMAYPAPQSNDAVKADIEASMTTLPPDAGMTTEQLKAKEKADRETQKKLQDQLDAVSEDEICVDDEGEILDETECAEFKNQQEKEVVDKKADSKDAKCESISGKTITDAAKCSEIVVADGKEKQAKAAYLDSWGH